MKPDLVILAGGKGTRIKKYLFNKQKCMATFNGKFFLSYLINQLSKFDINKIYILTGHKNREIHNKFHNKKVNFVEIKCLNEKKPMGTGGALYALKKFNINDFYLVNGDSILDINITNLRNKISKNSLGILSIIKNKNYKSNSKLSNLAVKNKRLVFSNKNTHMNAGIYYFKKKILKLISKKKISLESEIIPKLILKNKLDACLFNNKSFIDIGTPANYLKTEKHLIKNFKKPAAFLDRDGVINKDLNYVNEHKNFVLRKGVLKGLQLLRKKNYYIFIVTNQAGIAKKKFTLNKFEELHIKIKNEFQKKNIYIDNVKFCPHHPNGILKKYRIICKCRKPSNKMLIDLINEWDIDIKKSFMIGDKYTDKLCAKKSNINFFYAKEDFFKQITLLKKINKLCK